MTSREQTDWSGGPPPAVEPTLDPRVYLDLARRRFLYFIVPAAAIFGVGYWISQVLPPVYQARATILVESQQIPTGLATPTVTANAAERIQLIQQRLMARDNLLEIAGKFSLYPGERLSPSEVVDHIRSATRIQQIDVGDRSQSSQAIGFTVSFEDRDPGTSARVTNEFVASILQQNIQSRTSRAAETSKFFEQQVASLEQAVAAQASRIADFKRENQTALPETLNSRQSILNQLQSQLSDARSRVALLESERRLWENNPGQALATDSSTAAELKRLESQLVQLRALYADTHPEIRSIKARIAALRDAVAAEPDPADADTTTSSKPQPGTNAAHIAEIDSQLETLNMQIDAAQKRIDELTASIQQTPQIELALNALNRDYANSQSQLSQAQNKLAAAATGERLEEDRQAERFEVVEQASVPSAPTSPDRRRIVLAGSFGGVAAGIGLVVLIEMLDQSIRSVADLQRRLNIRPLSSIPYVATIAEKRRRRTLWLGLAAAVVIAVIAALVVIELYYLPLDMFARALVNRARSLVSRFGI